MAISRQYAVLANSAVSGDRAAMYALRALQAAPTAEARGALLKAAMTGLDGTIGDVGVDDVAVNPDGTMVATGRGGEPPQVWRTRERTRLSTNLPAEPHSAMKFSPDGRWLAIALPVSDRVWIWDARMGRNVAQLSGSGAIAWQLNGESLVVHSGTQRVLRFWSTDGWRVTREMAVRRADSIAVSPDGGGVLVGDHLVGELSLLSANGQLLWRVPGRGPWYTAWSPDGAIVAMANGAQAKVSLRDSASGDLRAEANAWNPGKLAFGPDSRLAILSRSGSIQVWDPRYDTWSSEDILTGTAVVGGDISADGRTAALVSQGRAVVLWRRDHGWIASRPSGAARLERLGDQLTVSADTGDFAVWQLSSRSRTKTGAFHAPGRVRRSADGLIARKVSPAAVQASDLAGKVLQDIQFSRNIGPLAFTADGKYLAISGGPVPGTAQRGMSDLALIDPLTGQQSARVGFDYMGQVLALESVPAQARLVVVTAGSSEEPAVASMLRVLGLPDLRSERVINLGSGTTNDLAMMSGSRAATVGPGRDIDVWDIDTGARVASFGDHPIPPTVVAASSDSRLIATGENSVVRLWDPDSGDLFAVFTAHSGPISDVEWTADGELITTAEDGKIGIWDVDTERVVQRLCRVVGEQADWRAVGVAPEDVPCPS
ncbi:WD40 repeat domain-containing protein [Actinokineospora diospyrosa]|uniref:WD40 repeat n=1 Tax=Actinokineospora diospyrosa TaxID=103728 RepID=A0ABT1I5C9_9PSEU|nr:WD40 repeat domain-containing protein [Actinokineospora diospyrosa]MCP2267825.1 WD40 repeat [Actinokineospora diospyrosa]